MRKIILAALLIGVAAPGIAQDREAWAARRAERQQQQADDPKAEARQERMEQRQVERAAVPQQIEMPRVEQQRVEMPRGERQRVVMQRGETPRDWRRADPSVATGAERVEQVRQWSRPAPQTQTQAQPASPVYEGNTGVAVRRWDGQRGATQQRATDWQQRQRGGWQHRRQQPVGQWQGTTSTQPPGGQWPGTTSTEQPRYDGQHWVSPSDGRRWTNDWRRDSRYDWQRYRAQNQSIFRVGSYYDPFGYGYRRPSIGYTLYAGYYSPDYWLDDPWQYRLPPAYGPYRWVRYFDDALLVDIYSGRVVDSIRNFFW